MEVFLIFWILAMCAWDVKGCSVPLWALLGGAATVMMAVTLRCNGGVDCMKVMCGALPGLLLLVLALCTKMIGYGDGIVVASLGAYCGVSEIVLLLMVSTFVLAGCSLVLLVLKRVKKTTRLPYLPFLAVGWFAVHVF